MMVFTWHKQPVPSGMPIRQVYGFCFDKSGHLLMRVEGAKHSLPGGCPEDGEDLAATLARECLEEVQILIEQPIYLGYQQVDDENGLAPYAQVRMTALIAEIRRSQVDPDTGRKYTRLLTSATRGGELLKWGELGHEQTATAAKVAGARYGVPVMNSGPDIWV